MSKIAKGYFCVTTVRRDDLKAAGFDATKVSDEDMELLAKKMGLDYTEQLFWSSLEILAKDVLGLEQEEAENGLQH